MLKDSSSATFGSGFICGYDFWQRAMLKSPKRSFVVVILIVESGESWEEKKTIRTKNVTKRTKKVRIEKPITKRHVAQYTAAVVGFAL